MKIPISDPGLALSPNFVAIDGEGYTGADGVHRYNLLAASDDSFIARETGLRSLECLNYLMGLALRYPDAYFVAFYFSYDTNMILRNITEDHRKQLAAEGSVILQDPKDPEKSWRIEYLPKKKTVITMRIRREGAKSVNMSMTIYDVWGFFQSSFVGALKQFGIGTPEELEAIEAMKGARSEFDVKDFEAVAKYNADECRLLVELMERVKDRMEAVGIKLKRWHGAGAVAGAIYDQHSIKQHLYTPDDPAFNNAVRSAYFGGRIQALQVGEFGECYQYDIISAYPSVMRNLASLRNVKERTVYEFVPNYPYAVYHVEWEIPTDEPVTPFPFRNPDGTIDYPYAGEGHYWFYEVEAALRHFGEYINIVMGYVFEVEDLESRPFHFINDMFEKRKELKKRGDHAQLCLKLGLNSLYGKTAQSVGRGKDRPPYQCYIFAGMITSGTRARMLDAAMQSPHSVVAFATDGILTEKPLDLPTENLLGNWEEAKYDSAFIIKPGFYEVTKDGTPTVRVRGFPMKTINFEELRTEFRKNQLNGTVKVQVRNFIGLKSASESRPWCSWQDSERVLKFSPARGKPEIVKPGRYRIIPPYVADGVSMIYCKDKAKQRYDPAENPEMEYFSDEE